MDSSELTTFGSTIVAAVARTEGNVSWSIEGLETLFLDSGLSVVPMPEATFPDEHETIGVTVMKSVFQDQSPVTDVLGIEMTDVIEAVLSSPSLEDVFYLGLNAERLINDGALSHVHDALPTLCDWKQEGPDISDEHLLWAAFGGGIVGTTDASSFYFIDSLTADRYEKIRPALSSFGLYLGTRATHLQAEQTGSTLGNKHLLDTCLSELYCEHVLHGGLRFEKSLMNADAPMAIFYSSAPLFDPSLSSALMLTKRISRNIEEMDPDRRTELQKLIPLWKHRIEILRNTRLAERGEEGERLIKIGTKLMSSDVSIPPNLVEETIPIAQEGLTGFNAVEAFLEQYSDSSPEHAISCYHLLLDQTDPPRSGSHRDRRETIVERGLNSAAADEAYRLANRLALATGQLDVLLLLDEYS